MSQPSGRVPILDPLRGLAACAVMWFHFTGEGGLRLADEGFSRLLRMSGSMGGLGVEVFFVISGFVLPYAMSRGGYRVRDFGTFLKKRLIRLEPPYLFAMAAAIALAVASTMAPGSRGAPFVLEWKQFAGHFGYVNAFLGYPWYNPVFWTLAIEFQFYLVIALVFPLAVHPRRPVRLAVPVVLAAVALLPVMPTLVLHYLALFSLGIATAQLYLGLASVREYAATFALVSAIAVFTLGPFAGGVGMVTALLIATSRGIAAEGRLARALQLRPLVWLGAVSYSIYLMHVPIGGRVINLGDRFVSHPLAQLAVILLGVAASLAASWAMHRWVEQPAQRWSSRVRYRGTKAARKEPAAVERPGPVREVAHA